MKRGYTLVEVLVALAIVSILAVPLGYVLETMSDGSRRALLEDQAIDLARECWTLTRAQDVDSLRDTTWDRSVSGRSWRVVRDVFDSADRADAGLPRIPARSAAPPPVEISACVLDRHGAAWDTVRCFRWLRPRAGMAP